MDQHDNSNHWRQMFGNARRGGPEPAQPGQPPGHGQGRSGSAPPFGYDDGFDPAREADAARQPGPLSPDDISDEAAMALGLDAQDYKPWILQRGRSRPAMMLHLRRYETKSGLWMGWQLSYPHLISVEYIGDKVLSLDFGMRQFLIEGYGLRELVPLMQQGTVLVLTEYTTCLWPNRPSEALIVAIRKVEGFMGDIRKAELPR